MTIRIGYKLTSENMTTYAGFKWQLNVPATTDGQNELCSSGWLHCYENPLLAVLHNPIHANFKNPRLFRAAVAGQIKTDGQMKLGCTKLTLTKEMPIPEITREQRVRYAIGCALAVYDSADFAKWATGWLSGKDRSARAAADAADAAAYAAANLIKIAKWAMGTRKTFPAIFVASKGASK